MTGVRTAFVLTVCAAAFGGVAGALFVAFTGPRTPAETATPPGRAAAPSPGPPTTPWEGHPPPPRGLTRRLDDADPAVRHALALELLREGPGALTQARALRPSTSQGVDLQSRLVAALDKMQLLRRATDYARLPEHIRMRLDLDAFASVVPERLLVGERVAYWRREIDAVRTRLEAGYAHPAEESIAVLELALARREAGEVDAASYADEARRLLPGIDEWLGARRDAPDAVPARTAELEAQVARLRP